jgi:hypothetical protein
LGVGVHGGVCAGVGQRQSDSFADASARAGDQSDSSRKYDHRRDSFYGNVDRNNLTTTRIAQIGCRKKRMQGMRGKTQAVQTGCGKVFFFRKSVL